MAQIESVVEPDSVLNDFRWESIPLIQVSWSLHPAILNQQALICQYPMAIFFEGRLDDALEI